MKKVSLILTTFNSEINLPDTLKSIEMQDYDNIEVIIKDGESKDNTINIIEKYVLTSKYKVKWISCADIGIYDAMNQGFQLCHGDMIAFFNDKFLVKNAITLLVEEYDKQVSDGNQHCVGVHSDLVYMREANVVRYWKMGNGVIQEGWMPGHPTLLLKREVYEQYGLYNSKYRISGDYEFMIRFLKDKRNQLAYVPKTLIAMFYGGTSNNSIKSYWLSYKEGHQALRDNEIKNAFLIDIKRTIKVFKQFKNK